MEIKTLPLGLIKSNCYLVTTDKSALVIDPGFKSDKVLNLLSEHSEKEKLILITHSHFDHIGGAEYLRENTGAKIAIGALDAPALSDPEKNLSNKFHAHVKPFNADILLEDNEILNVGDLEIKTIATPGHSKGGVCFLINGVLFSGDTLFFESVGRTDFGDGSFEELLKSVKKLYTLPPETVVYSGHGEKTTIDHERLLNPFVKENL